MAFMYGNAKNARAAAQRSAEHRKNEDESPRLSAGAPGLASLRIEVTQRGLGGTTKHTKLVVVERAPALFVIACAQPACREGGHDITREVMYALARRCEEYSGESSCGGTTGNAPCSETLTYRMIAEFRDPQAGSDR
jgi:hypothetical protein